LLGLRRLTLCIWAALVSHFSFPSFSVIESSRRYTCAIEIFAREDWPEWAVEPGLSDANPVGEFTVVPDDSGEKAALLEEPGPPPPPVPPTPGMDPVAEEKWDPADGVCARNFGDESD
jgi:hypothetical protein